MSPFFCIRTIKNISTLSFIFPFLWYLLVAIFVLRVIKDSLFPHDFRSWTTIADFFSVLIHSISMRMLSKTLQLCAGASTIFSIILTTFIFVPIVTFITLLLRWKVELEVVITIYVLLAFGVSPTTWILRKCMVWTPHRCSFYFTIFNGAVKSVI